MFYNNRIKKLEAQVRGGFYRIGDDHFLLEVSLEDSLKGRIATLETQVALLLQHLRLRVEQRPSNISLVPIDKGLPCSK